VIVVNAGFMRSVRARRGRFTREWKNVQGVQLDLSWEGDHKPIRDALLALYGGEGWQLQGYCLIAGPEHQVPVTVS
jgi:hypothetical protein